MLSFAFLLLFAQTFASITLGPVFIIDRIDEGLNLEITSHVVSYIQSTGAFTEDNGPKIMEIMKGSTVSFNDHDISCHDCRFIMTRDGSHDIYSFSTFLVAGGGQMAKVVVSVLFKHEAQKDDPPASFGDPLPSVLHYRPDRISVVATKLH